MLTAEEGAEVDEDEAKVRGAIEARLRRDGSDRSPLARWVRLNRSWLEGVLRESRATWASVAEALVEEGVIPAPKGWAADDAAERAGARLRLANALAQAWRRERLRRPGPAPVRRRKPEAPPVRDVFAAEPRPGVPAPVVKPGGGSDRIERMRRLLAREGRRHVDPEPADGDENDALLRPAPDGRSGRRQW
jgi:hypothetical protein